MNPPIGSQSITAQLYETLRQVCLRTNDMVGYGNAVRIKMFEESLTDFNLIDIAIRHAPHVVTKKFNRIEEGEITGADWLWVIGRPGRWLPVLVQAKIVNTKTLKCTGFRQKRSDDTSQLDLLVKYAMAQRFFPIYCVYNWSTNPQVGPFVSCCDVGDEDPRYLGCTILLPEQVRRFNASHWHPKQGAIIEQGHSLACLFKDHPLADVKDIAGVAARAFMRYQVEVANREEEEEGRTRKKKKKKKKKKKRRQEEQKVPTEFEKGWIDQVPVPSNDLDPQKLMHRDLPPMVRELFLRPTAPFDVPMRYVTIVSDQAIPPDEILREGWGRG